MSFEQLLILAQSGNEAAAAEILSHYKPLLVKESISNGFFDEDLYQELCIAVIKCIRNFRI